MSQVSLDLLSSLAAAESAGTALPVHRRSDDKTFPAHLARAQSAPAPPENDASTGTSRGHPGDAAQAQPAPPARDAEPEQEPEPGVPVRGNQNARSPDETDAPAPAAAEEEEGESAGTEAGAEDLASAVLVSPTAAETSVPFEAPAPPPLEDSAVPVVEGELPPTAEPPTTAGPAEIAAARGQPLAAVAEASAASPLAPEDRTPPIPGGEGRARTARAASGDDGGEEGGEEKPPLPENVSSPAAAAADAEGLPPLPAADPSQATGLPGTAAGAKGVEPAEIAGRKKPSRPFGTDASGTFAAGSSDSRDKSSAGGGSQEGAEAIAAAGAEQLLSAVADAAASAAPVASGDPTPAQTSAAASSAPPAAGAATAATTPGSGDASAGVPATANADQSEQARHVEQARFAQRVSRAFEAIGERSGSLRLKLSPPELGSLRLEISVEHGVLNARLEAETPAARNLLLESLPALRERLAQQEIRVERFDVELMDRRPGEGAEQFAGQSESGRQPSQQPTARRQSLAETSVATAGGGSPTSTDPNHLNILI